MLFQDQLKCSKDIVERATIMLNGKTGVKDIAAATASLNMGWTQMKTIETKIMELRNKYNN